MLLHSHIDQSACPAECARGMLRGSSRVVTLWSGPTNQENRPGKLTKLHVRDCSVQRIWRDRVDLEVVLKRVHGPLEHYVEAAVHEGRPRDPGLGHRVVEDLDEPAARTGAGHIPSRLNTYSSTVLAHVQKATPAA